MESFFICHNCQKYINNKALGTKNRNHCPYCLWSLHVDERIGDRRAHCQGLMKPIGLTTKKDGEIMLIHQCVKCGKISTNRIAGDDESVAIEKIFQRQDDRVLESLGVTSFKNKKELMIQLYGKNYDLSKNL